MKQIVGVDIGGTKMYLCARDGERWIERRVPTGIDCTREYLKQQLEEFISSLPFAVDAVGMAVPGLVTSDRFCERSDVVPALSGVDASFFAQGRFPVRYLNDVRCAAVEEASHYSSDSVVAVLMAGTGIALSVSERGHLLHGSGGFSGELGHCYVGTAQGYRMIDELCSGAEILRRAHCAAPEFLERLQNREEEAYAIVKQAGEAFGMALAMVINLYNPDVIVIGGGTAGYPGYLDAAKQAAEKLALAPSFAKCRFCRPKDPTRIVALGAIRYAAQAL